MNVQLNALIENVTQQGLKFLDFLHSLEKRTSFRWRIKVEKSKLRSQSLLFTQRQFTDIHFQMRNVAKQESFHVSSSGEVKLSCCNKEPELPDSQGRHKTDAELKIRLEKNCAEA